MGKCETKFTWITLRRKIRNLYLVVAVCSVFFFIRLTLRWNNWFAKIRKKKNVQLNEMKTKNKTATTTKRKEIYANFHRFKRDNVSICVSNQRKCNVITKIRRIKTTPNFKSNKKEKKKHNKKKRTNKNKRNCNNSTNSEILKKKTILKCKKKKFTHIFRAKNDRAWKAIVARISVSEMQVCARLTLNHVSKWNMIFSGATTSLLKCAASQAQLLQCTRILAPFSMCERKSCVKILRRSNMGYVISLMIFTGRL